MDKVTKTLLALMVVFLIANWLALYGNPEAPYVAPRLYVPVSGPCADPAMVPVEAPR